jgi:hypothetical protein
VFLGSTTLGAAYGGSGITYNVYDVGGATVAIEDGIQFPV